MPDRAETSHIAALVGFAAQGKQTFVQNVTEVSIEPDSVIVIPRCARSRHGKR